MSEIERCISCGGVLLDDDEVFNDYEGGYIHAKCCAPDGFVDETGKHIDHVPDSFKFGDLNR